MASEGKDRRWLWTNRNLTHKANLKFQPQFFCQLKHPHREGSGPSCQGIYPEGKKKTQQARINKRLSQKQPFTLAFRAKHALSLNSLSLKIMSPNIGSWIPMAEGYSVYFGSKPWCSPNCSQGSGEFSRILSDDSQSLSGSLRLQPGCA